ncbi:hypothetical protein RCL1_006809 [Eukaryota sp. TZLM3-RCL]
MTRYKPPLMSASEIEAYLEEMSIPFTSGFLNDKGDKGLSADPIISVLTCLLEYFYGVTMEDLCKIPDDVIGEYDQSEPLHHGFGAISLYRNLYELFKNIGYTDFRLTDVLNPDRKRCQFQISSLLNFVKFRENRLESYNELQQGLATIEQDLEVVKAQEYELNKQLFEKNALEASEEPLLKEVLLQIEGLGDSLRQAHLQSEVLSKEVTELKQNCAKIEAESEGKRLELIQIQQEIEVLSGKVTDSPTTLRDQINEIERKISDVELGINNDKSKLIDFNKRKEGLTSIMEIIPKIINILEHLKQCRTKKNQLTDSVSKLTKNSVENESNLENLDVKIRHFEKKNKILTDQLERAQSSHEIRREGFRSKRLELTERLKSEQQSRHELDSECKLINEEIIELRANFDSIKNERDEEILQLNELISEAEAVISNYHERILNHIK